MKLIIINGPNLNLLGTREPEIYGSKSFQEYFKTLQRKFSTVSLTYYQSNIEGELIDKLHEVGFSFDAIRELQQLVKSDVYHITPRINKLGTASYDIKLTAKGTKEGNAVLEKLWGAHVGSAYQQSFQLVNKFQFDDWVGAWLSKESRAGQ
ncbi:MAG: 3-dehydroquinate dehydratase, partial [Flavobacteriaceae bacterium]|nr:3-dehydroquinate dehydratase [Flavobacteriaceae bacterium]